MIARITEAKTLVKHISCDCKCKFNNTTCNSNKKWNDNKCPWECKKFHTCKEDYSWYPRTCTCRNSRYLKSTIDNSVTLFDEIRILCQ